MISWPFSHFLSIGRTTFLYLIGLINYVLETPPVPLGETELTRQFVSNLGKRIRHLEPEHAWIFGSSVECGFYAKDIDVLIVSSEFNGIRYPVRRTMVDWPSTLNIDTWLFTVEEFENIPVDDDSIRASLERERIDITQVISHEV